MTDFDDALTAEIAKTTAKLVSYGYEPYDDHEWIKPGVRVRHVGEQYPEATEGTAVIAAVYKHRGRVNDYEVIVVRDKPHFGSRVAQWANYHCVKAVTL